MGQTFLFKYLLTFSGAKNTTPQISKELVQPYDQGRIGRTSLVIVIRQLAHTLRVTNKSNIFNIILISLL
jgi:hypothetical protein